ncbi:hypothetical protein GCM10009830_39430 [Glycomyces endophyticus]|uniref:Tetratricopeptide repeat protein n=2 Tax=Glycomyces endophyticus TaxID=480996 RepID=A0ABN2HHB5_9ACTN
MPQAQTDRETAARYGDALLAQRKPPWYSLAPTSPTGAKAAPDDLPAAQRDLLRLVAHLGAAPVPLGLLDGDLPASLAAPANLVLAAAHLGAAGLARVDRDTLSIDLWLAKRLRDATPAPDRHDLLTSARRLLRRRLPDHRLPEARPAWRALLPHALAAAGDVTAGDVDDATWLMERAAAYLQQYDQLDAAQLLLDRSLTVKQERYGVEHPELAATLGDLGAVLVLRGETDRAERELTRAVGIAGAAHGRNSVEVARPVAHLGVLMHDLGRLEDARDLHAWALRNTMAGLGSDHPETAERAARLAGVLHDLGDLDTARALYEQALAIGQHADGPGHPALAGTVAALGAVLKDLGDPGAADVLERALAMRLHDDDQRGTASILVDLGVAHQQQGRTETAGDHLARAVVLARDTGELQVLALALRNLAVVEHLAERPARRAALMDEAVAAFEAGYGPDHPLTVECRALRAAWT